MGGTRSRAAVLSALVALGVFAAMLGQPARASASSQALEVLTWSYHEPVAGLWIDGRIANPTQTAVTDVVVSVRLYNSSGTLFKTVTLPANCIVLDGLATTTFCLAHIDGAAENAARSYSVTATGRPTFRRALFLPVTIDSRRDYDNYESIGRSYTVTVTNDHAFDVTGTIVYGQERQQAAGGLFVFLNALRTESMRGLALAPGQTGLAVLSTLSWHSTVVETATVFAEAVPAPAPGLTVETTEVLSPYGGPASIIGTVRNDTTLAGVGGAKVTYRSSADGVVWSRPATLTASAAGSFTLTSRATRATVYAFWFAGQVGVAAPSGPVTVTVLPRIVISAPVSASTAVCGQWLSVTGTLSPRHSSGPLVKVLCYRKIGGEWVVGVEATATVTKVSSSASKYAARVKVPFAGTWRIVATAPADSLHAYTVSAAKSVVAGKTTLAIAANRTKVYFTKSATLTGTLLDARGKGISGRPVVFESSINGGKNYSTVRTLTTDSLGRVKASVKPTTKTVYRFRFAGDETRASSRSAAKTITSSALVRTLDFGPDANTPRTIKGVYLTAGKHEIRTTSSIYWDTTGPQRLRGVVGTGRSAAFKTKRSGTFTFTIVNYTVWPRATSATVTIW